MDCTIPLKYRHDIETAANLLKIESKIDLIDFDANPDFFSMVNRIGKVVQIG
jgi:hypothetical protein